MFDSAPLCFDFNFSLKLARNNVAMATQSHDHSGTH
jgi:hypothetical protein